MERSDFVLCSTSGTIVCSETTLAEDNLEASGFTGLGEREKGTLYSVVDDVAWLRVEVNILLTVFRSSPKDVNDPGKGGGKGKELARGVGIAEELGVCTPFTGEWLSLDGQEDEVTMVRHGTTVRVGVEESEPELRSEVEEVRLWLNALPLGGGVAAGVDDEKELKNVSVEVDDDAESLFERVVVSSLSLP